MELRIAVQELSRALSLMQGIVQRKNTMPILANVLLEIEDCHVCCRPMSLAVHIDEGGAANVIAQREDD